MALAPSRGALWGAEGKQLDQEMNSGARGGPGEVDFSLED